MIYRKYEFASQEEAVACTNHINLEELGDAVYLGKVYDITEEGVREYDENFHMVDALLHQELLEYREAEVYPIPTDCHHFFAGTEQLYIDTFDAHSRS